MRVKKMIDKQTEDRIATWNQGWKDIGESVNFYAMNDTGIFRTFDHRINDGMGSMYAMNWKLGEKNSQTHINNESSNLVEVKTDNGGLGQTYFLSSLETSKVIENAKFLNTTVTAVLFHALDKACLDLGLRKQDFWLVPINVRNEIEFDDKSSNCASYIVVKGGFKTPHHAKELIVEKITKKDHLRIWKRMAFFDFLPRAIKRFLIKTILRYYNRSSPVIGTFSSIGRWVLDGDNKNNISLIVSVSKASPIGATCIQTNGNLNLSIHLHHTILNNPNSINLIHQWRSNI